MAVSCTQGCGAQERVSVVAGGPAEVRWRGYLERDSAPKDHLQGKVTPAERLGVGWAAEGKAGG